MAEWARREGDQDTGCKAVKRTPPEGAPWHILERDFERQAPWTAVVSPLNSPRRQHCSELLVALPCCTTRTASGEDAIRKTALVKISSQTGDKLGVGEHTAGMHTER